MAIVFFGLLVVTSYIESGLPAQPAWYLTVTAILGVLGGSCFTAWLSMSIYEFISNQGQERGYKREFDVDLTKNLYGPLYDELMIARIGITYNFELRELPQLDSLKWKYLRLLVPESLLDKRERLTSLAASYRQSFGRTGYALDVRGAQLATAFVERLGGSMNVESFSGQKDRLQGGEWRAALGSESLEANLDRLCGAVGSATKPASQNEASQLAGEFKRDFTDAIKSDPAAVALIGLRGELDALASEVITQLKPLIQTPYLGEQAS